MMGQSRAKINQIFTGKKHIVPVILLVDPDSTKAKDINFATHNYLMKPFALSDLQEEIRYIFQQQSLEKTQKLTCGELELDPAAHRVIYKHQQIKLSDREYAILKYFMYHSKMVISRTMLKKQIWNYDFESVSNLIDVYIRRLRRKIGDDNSIQTVRGAGYRLGQ